MGYSDYSYLDLTVMAFLRKRVISQDAAVLFSPEMDRVLWANAFGAKLFSGSGLAELLDVHLSPTHPLVRQIAGYVARRIVCYAETGMDVQQGDELGFIKFGSRVDLFLPLNAKIEAALNDVVVGNQTVIARF